MRKAYICKLKFDIVEWQLWFMAEDNSEVNEKWHNALRGLNTIGDSCSTSDEFYVKAIEYFELHGFVHVVK